MLRRFGLGLLLFGVTTMAGCTGTSDEGYGVPGEAEAIEAAPVETGTDKATIEIAPAQQLPAGGGRPPRGQ